MAITEQHRHDLYVALEAAIGPEQATTLMEHLPPVGWADVATKQDLDHLQLATAQDIALARTELGAEITTLRTELGAEITTLRSDMTSLGETLRAEFHRDQRNLTLAVLGANAGLTATVAALAFAAAKLV